ncbi:MAG: MFS transporter [Candidatus Thalassarchaeaceae archaeon]
MRYHRRSLSIGIVLLLAISCFVATTSAQSGEENHPTEDDPYMYFWGNEDLSECWNNFDSNASMGSASEGYGEIFFPEGQDVNVELSCNLHTGFSDDFILEINKSISIRMKFNIESGNCGNDCTDLTLTLFRGQEQISQHVEPANSVNNGNDFTTQWDILVNDSIRAWAQDTQISISVAYSVPAEGGPLCQSPIPTPGSDCSGNFRMYYSDEGGSPGDVHAEFPIYVSLTDVGSNAGKTNLGPIIFILPFIAITILLGWVGYREGWRAESEEEFDFAEWGLGTLEKINPMIWGPTLVSGTKNAFSEWRKGGALTVNKTRRITTLCLLYFAQGLPWGFASVTFAAYLVKNGTPIGDIAVLFATIALPWTFKWIWGPIVDSVFIERFGPRRQWILFAQTGMALTLGSLILIPDLNSKIELVTRILFIHNIFASLQDVATDALAVEILQPDEVAKVNGFMFAAKRGGIIVGGAVLGVLVSYIDISGVIVAQLVLLLAIISVPLTMVEKPGVKLFPWSVVEAVLSDSDEEQGGQDDEESETPWEDEIDFRVARTVGYSVSEEKISFASFFAIVGLSIWFLGFAVDVFTIDWSLGGSLREITNPASYSIISLAVLSLLVSKLNDNLPSIINPFKLIPTSSRNAVARTSFYLAKAFSVRSALLLIGLCLLSELYIFVGPIVIDIFINEAGWSQAKYNGIVGGIVVFGALFGQIFGGLLGDKYGTRRVAMVGFTILALANATLAFLEPMWNNTTLMTFYLIIQAFVGGIAWICIISLSMRLTWSKVGGTQFTAYMSLFNLSGVIAYGLTGRMIEVFNYSTAIYIGAALTMLTVIMLIFIDEDETDRVLEGRLDDDDEDGDESWWNEEGQVMEGAELGEHASLA